MKVIKSIENSIENSIESNVENCKELTFFDKQITRRDFIRYATIFSASILLPRFLVRKAIANNRNNTMNYQFAGIVNYQRAKCNKETGICRAIHYTYEESPYFKNYPRNKLRKDYTHEEVIKLYRDHYDKLIYEELKQSPIFQLFYKRKE